MHQSQHLDLFGFHVANPHIQVNADLPQQLGCYINEWSRQIFQDLSEEGVIPKEGLLLIQQSNGCGYMFLRNACLQFHPYIMKCAVLLTSTHPHQGLSTSFNNY